VLIILAAILGVLTYPISVGTSIGTVATYAYSLNGIFPVSVLFQVMSTVLATELVFILLKFSLFAYSLANRRIYTQIK